MDWVIAGWPVLLICPRLSGRMNTHTCIQNAGSTPFLIAYSQASWKTYCRPSALIRLGFKRCSSRIARDVLVFEGWRWGRKPVCKVCEEGSGLETESLGNIFGCITNVIRAQRCERVICSVAMAVDSGLAPLKSFAFSSQMWSRRERVCSFV